MGVLLLHDVRQKRHETRALDGDGEGTLLLGRNGGDEARYDLAALGDEALEQLHVLVVDLRRVGAGEGARLLATEKRTALTAATCTCVAHCTVSCVWAAGVPSSPSVLLSSRSRLF